MSVFLQIFKAIPVCFVVFSAISYTKQAGFCHFVLYHKVFTKFTVYCIIKDIQLNSGNCWKAVWFCRYNAMPIFNVHYWLLKQTFQRLPFNYREVFKMSFSPKEIPDFVEENDVKFYQTHFSDMFGNLKNIAIMPDELPAFQYGVSFDASCLTKEYSDLLLVPDISTLSVLPCPKIRQSCRFFAVSKISMALWLRWRYEECFAKGNHRSLL